VIGKEPTGVEPIETWLSMPSTGKIDAEDKFFKRDFLHVF
jgi:hypothetical protein